MPNVLSQPVWIFKGRTYKTVSGLSKAIFADCECDSHTMVIDRKITATIGRHPNQLSVAEYYVSEPVAGKPMTVTRISPIETSYVTGHGDTVNIYYTRTYAVERLAFLDAAEARSKAMRPTDSGTVRQNYQAEANALRVALSTNHHPKISEQEFSLIERIAERAVKLADYLNVPWTKVECILDVVNVHLINPLDLQRLLEARDVHFNHDLFGIRDNFNRETLKLIDGFSPRHTKFAQPPLNAPPFVGVRRPR